jgi:dihydrofolate reductase
MARLVYSALASLDGFTEDAGGEIGWAVPDDEVHGFVNDLERPIGTYLYGRRMYEVMVAWETIADERPHMRDYAEIWRAAEKVVFSKTLEAAGSARTRIEREFDPATIAEMKASASQDISVGGPELASQAIGAGLVDEIHLFLAPVAIGAGKPALPTGQKLALELQDLHKFRDGTLHLHYSLP